MSQLLRKGIRSLEGASKYLLNKSYTAQPTNFSSQQILGLQRQINRCYHVSGVNYHKCELTRKRYPVRRGEFATIIDADLTYFRKVLGERGVITSDLDGYNTDWLGMVRGESSVLLRPRTTKHVSKILKYCNERKLAVCPQGGNTGLVGGSVPVFDEVILSMNLMNKIENVDELSDVMTCEAGCVLQTLDEHLETKGLMMPLDLGAKGSCQIGGNISTNAGGLRLLRYGSLQGSVLGIEAVLANGEVLDSLHTLRKDNTGYHVKHLMIGAEGTLGVVTRVAILCSKRPTSINLALLSVNSFEEALKTSQLAKNKLGEILSSCEFVDHSSMESVTKNLNLQLPIGENNCYMLIETSGSNAEHDQAKLEEFLDLCLNSEGITDGTLASEPSRMQKIWQLRERIAESLLKEGYCFKYDFSFPQKDFYKLVDITRQYMGDSITRCCGYGHLGDGNLHLNITIPEYSKLIASRLEPWIYEQTAKLNGSISAEHGLGFKKRNSILFSKDKSAVKLMKQIKQIMDPNGILNPYKVLPDDKYL